MGDWVIATGFSRDGRLLYTVTRSGALAEWSIEPLERKRTIPLSLRFVHAARFDDGGEVAAIAGTLSPGGLEDGAAEAISLGKGVSLGVERQLRNLCALEFVPGRRQLIVASGSRLVRMPLA
jgi:hypothetical protein